MVPLESLPDDLASAATTPNFAWISPDDARGSPPPTTWVANYGSATFTPVNLASRKAGKVIPVGTDRPRSP